MEPFNLPLCCLLLISRGRNGHPRNGSVGHTVSLISLQECKADLVAKILQGFLGEGMAERHEKGGTRVVVPSGKTEEEAGRLLHHLICSICRVCINIRHPVISSPIDFQCQISSIWRENIFFCLPLAARPVKIALESQTVLFMHHHRTN